MQNKNNNKQTERRVKKIKASEVKQYREQYLVEQDNTCALCKQHVEPSDAVLDHCHQTGYLRGVLHRFCNTYLGAIENNVKRNKITNVQLTSILSNAQAYMQSRKDVLHPTYRTPEEKALRAKRKRARARKSKQNERSVTSRLGVVTLQG